jgi:hypothetical protein
MATTELEQARHEIFIGIAKCLVRLGGKASHFLTQPQRVALAEQCRDTADVLDCGFSDRLRHARRLVLAERGLGRPLYRLI